MIRTFDTDLLDYILAVKVVDAIRTKRRHQPALDRPQRFHPDARSKRSTLHARVDSSVYTSTPPPGSPRRNSAGLRDGQSPPEAAAPDRWGGELTTYSSNTGTDRSGNERGGDP
jgi:hypothetical protein